MQSITKTITLYTIDELSDSARQKALEYISSREYEFYPPELITEMLKMRLEENGYPTGDVRWSLGYSQGDGVAWYGKVERLDKVIKRIFLDKSVIDRMLRSIYSWEPTFTISPNAFGNRYSNWNTMSLDWTVETYNEINREDEDNFNFIQQLMKQDIRNLSKELALMGYNELESVQEEQYVLNLINQEEYLFDEKGRLWCEFKEEFIG